MALDAGGSPVISYWDETNGDLKLVHCGDPGCGAGNVITSVDGSQTEVGEGTSLVLDAGGNPVISYHDRTNGDLKVIHCSNPNCAGVNSITSPDGVDDVALSTSLALDGAGNPIVAYTDSTNRDLKILHRSDPNCSAGNTITTPDTGIFASFPSLMLDALGNPVVAYQAFPINLRVIHCGNPICSAGNVITTVDASALVGSWPSLALDDAGFPVVSYYDANNNT